MLKILPVDSKEKQEEYCLLTNVEYDADQMCYAAFDDGNFIGVSLFRIIGQSCVIYRVKLTDGTDDHLAIYLLAKAPMNFADLCGIKEAIFKDENTSLAKELKFVENDGLYKVDLDGYFTTPCKGDCGH